MRLMRLCAATVLVAGMSAAVAQPPGGGRGGFGMMGGGGGPAGLVGSKTVQEAIKATEEQVSKLKEWSQAFTRKQMEGMKERAADFQGLEPAEMRKKFVELQAETSKKAYTELAEVLKPEQLTRLKGIAVQVAGPGAFSMPDVQEAIKPTDEQKDKLKDAVEAFTKEERELREEMGLGFRPGQGGGKGERPDPAKQADFNKKRAGMVKELMGKVDGMLTADQKDAWKKLTGEAVDTAKVQQEVQAAAMANIRKKKDD